MEESIITPELKVLNLKESLDFYTRLAGFEILYDRPENKFAMLNINGARSMLEELTDDSRMWKVGKLERPLGRGMHFQVESQDIDSLYKKFIDEKYPIFLDMEEKWYRKNNIEVGHKQFRVLDPDGYQYRFYGDLGERPISGI